MHLDVTDGTIFAGFKVAHNAHLANCKAKKKKKRKHQLASEKLTGICRNMQKHIRCGFVCAYTSEGIR